MPMRAGEMMVVVRAQDFASRTLRRVSAEMAGMSRAQRMAAMQADVAFGNQRALDKLTSARSNMRNLRYLERHLALETKLAAAKKAQAAAQQKLNTARVMPTGAGGRFAPRTAMQTASIAPAAAELARLQQRFNALDTAVKKSDGRLAQLPTRFQRLRFSAANLGEAMTAGNRALQDAYYGLTRAQRAQLAFNQALKAMPAQRLSDVGHALSGIGRIMQLTGLIGSAAFLGAANSAANFSKEVSLAGTQMRDLQAPIAQATARSQVLGDAIVEMMMRFPAAGQEMASAAYDIFSSMNIVHNGIVDVAGGLNLLDVANRAAVAGGVSLEQATDAMIVTLNNFDPALQNVTGTMDDMFSIVRFGQMRLNDFAVGMGQLAPVASTVGLSLKQVGGAFAALTILTKNQSTASAGLGRAIELLNLPAFTEGLKKWGVQTKDASGRMRPILDIMRDLVKVFPEMASGQKSAVEALIQISKASGLTKAGIQGTVQARRAIAQMTTHLGLFENVQNNINKNTGEMGKAFRANMKAPGVQWSIFLNQMRALVILIGQEALPVFISFGQRIAGIVRWFHSLNPETRGLIVRIGVITSLLTLFAGITLSVVGSLKALQANIMLSRLAANQATGSFLTMRAALLSIGFLGVGILLSQLIGVKRAVIDMTAVWLVWRSAAIGSAVASAAAHVIAARTFTIAWRRALTKSGWGLIAIAAGVAADYIITHWDKVREWFLNFWDELRIDAIDTADTILSAFSWLPGRLGDWARNAREGFNREIGGIRIASHMREEVAENTRVMDSWLKREPKKVAAERKRLQQILRSGIFPTGMNRAGVQQALNSINAAYKRMRDASKKGMGGFMKDWKELSAGLVTADWLKQQQAIADALGEGSTASDEAADRARQMAQTARDAAKQAADSIHQLYANLRAENQTLFGEFAQGPWLTSETFDLAKEWGISPRIQDLTKDLQMQRNTFTNLTKALGTIAKRGAPKELIDQLRTMGPDALPLIQAIAKAKPGQFNALVREFKTGQRMIDNATKADFTKTISTWQKSGKDMGQAILDGFQEAGVPAFFDNWIKQTFPNLISSAVATAVSDWKAQNPPTANAKVPTPGSPGGPPATQPTTPGAGIGVAAGLGGSIDNSKTIHVQIGDSEHKHIIGGSADAARQTAFILRNRLKRF